MGSMKKLLITPVAVALLICLAIGGNRIYEDLPSTRYQQAVSLMQEKQYAAARKIFAEIKDHKDSRVLLTECKWREALAQYLNGDVQGAKEKFKKLFLAEGAYPEYVRTPIHEYWLDFAKSYIAKQHYDQALSAASNIFVLADEIYELLYQEALRLRESNDFTSAIEIFDMLGTSYRDCPEQSDNTKCQYAIALINEGRYDEAKEQLLLAPENAECQRILELYYTQRIAEESIIYEKKYYTGGWISWDYQYDAGGVLTGKSTDDTTYTYTYENGMLVKEAYISDNPRINHTMVYEYRYDAQGNLIRKDKRYTELGEGVSASDLYWEYEYDKNGRLCTETEKQKYVWFRFHYYYDAAGRVIKKIEDQVGIDGTTEVVALRSYDYRYDETGNLVEETFFWKDSVYRIDLYTYDEHGNLITCEEKRVEDGEKETAKKSTYTYDWYYSGK